MPYGLGIDLGTSCTVAALMRAIAGNADPEVVSLGLDAPGVPTVLHVDDDGTMLIGPAAEPLVITDPDRVYRDFLRNFLADDLRADGGRRSSPDLQLRPATLTARLVRWMVDAVAQREGGPPQQITLAHPAAWGSAECGVLRAGLAEVGLPGVQFVPVPLAAAAAYYGGNSHRARDGDNSHRARDDETLAIYDLGATFTASVTRHGIDGTTMLGPPRVLDDGGGTRFDELVLTWVLDQLGDQLATADLADEVVLTGMARLLADCVAAREALHHRPEARIPINLPGLQTEVRLTADELSMLLEPTLRDTVAALREAISDAHLTPDNVDAVLVTGGCAHLPLVAALLGAELGRPVTVLAEPELAAARGIAFLARPRTDVLPVGQALATPSPGDELPDDRTEQLPVVPVLADAWVGPFPQVIEPAGRHRPRSRTLLAVAAGILAVATITVPLILLRAPDSGAEPSPSRSTSNHGDPAQGGAPAYGGAVAPPLVPASTDATMPAPLPEVGPASLTRVASAIPAPVPPGRGIPPIPGPTITLPTITPPTITSPPRTSTTPTPTPTPTPTGSSPVSTPPTGPGSGAPSGGGTTSSSSTP
jgi:hypothetical protein